MVNRYFEVVDASTIKYLKLVRSYTKTGLQADIAEYQELLDLSDDAKMLIIGSTPGINTIEEFDAGYEAVQGEAKDILDYWDYETEDHSITAAKGMWWTPAAVQSFCDEQGGYPATNCIDGDTATIWRSPADERHWIILDMGYRKMCKRVSIRIDAGDPNSHKLEEVNVHVGEDLDSFVQVGTLVDFQTEGQWNTYVFPNEVGRYVKLDNMHTLNAGNSLRIREIRVYVKTINHED